jgi:hypothetical protein
METWIVPFHEGKGTVVDGESHDGHVVCVENPVNKSNPFPPEPKERESEVRRGEEKGKGGGGRGESQGQEFDCSMKDFSEEEPMLVREREGGPGDLREIERQDVIVEGSLQIFTTLTWAWRGNEFPKRPRREGRADRRVPLSGSLLCERFQMNQTERSWKQFWR